ncbi:MmgE/PrpD family protein [Pollutimonas bauzanensis]|uniref:2-methylcitrate dehydratase PrpD n=1 Tax=Pollutimonas bauzanensis TaxID=658167 RepID=A0A1M5SH99_9BURK|nr:MmgE/PrpD family protein [Pollutimonas bauzanensis]SHH37780.1 2-methylcitrate dehydratase PrpD [Pollutimonas bauzanensis]
MDDLDAWKRQARKHRGITGQLADFIAGIKPEAIPAATRNTLHMALIDALGCGLYGLTTPWGRILGDFVSEQGGVPEAGLWGRGKQVSAGNAVLLAATAVHSFDFDDHSRAKIHPGAIVVPVALALAERENADAGRVIAAMAAGYETMNRVSQAANPSRARMRGWHLTGTTGTFAAAATASVLLGLDGPTTASALGLAGTQSAGLWAFTADGGMSKRLHPGRAAQAGITAALLAQRGFQGPRYILEAEDGGFLFAMSDSPRPEQITERLGSRWHTEETCFKPYACCGSNHACVDAAIELAIENAIDLNDIVSVTAGVPSVVQTQTGFDYRADSVLNAQMSLRYNIAVAILDKQAYLEQFSLSRISEPRVFELAQRIEIEVDPELDRRYPEIYGGRVSIAVRSGKIFTRRVDYSKGMPENPMSVEDIKRKYMSLAAAGAGIESATEILELAGSLFSGGSAKEINTRLARVSVHAEEVADTLS